MAMAKLAEMRHLGVHGRDGRRWGHRPSSRMINPVFVRIRDDKQVRRPDVRSEQSGLRPMPPRHALVIRRTLACCPEASVIVPPACKR